MAIGDMDGTDFERRALIATAVMGAALAPVAARAAKSRGKATPQDAAAAFDRAIVARDRQALDRLLADDFLWVRGSGVRAGRQAFLEGLAAPGIVIEPYRPSEARWFVSGDIAVIVAVNDLRGTDNGAPLVDRHSFCDIWQLRGRAWQLVYAQVTRVPAEEK